MTATQTPTRPEVDRQRTDSGGAGVGIWVITTFVALLALVVSIVALVVSVSHESKTVHTAASAPSKPAAGSPTVQLSEYKVAVGASTYKPGKVDFTIANGGTVEHELLVFRTDQPPSAFPIDAEGDINEEALNKISDGDNIAPGASQTRTIDLSQPGTYTFVCNLPGHFKAGMYQTITVG